MPETIEELVRAAIAAAQAAGDLPEFEVEDCGVERPADTSHGEWTSTVALRSARLAHMAPAKIAAEIAAHMPSDPAIEKIEVAGPGFVNFYLSHAASNEIFATVREQGSDFGRSDVGHGQKIQVEFVSANPVGPMHVGHGRWAALGDSICRVFAHTNFDVEPEFYINDHGSQMDVFGGSVSKRYMQLVDIMGKEGVGLDAARDILATDRNNYVEDEDDERPDSHPYMDAFTEELGGNSYGGTYIIDLAADFYRTDGDKWASAPDEDRMVEFRERAYQQMVEDMRQTCHDVRCDFDVWFSERSLYVKDETGTSQIDRAFKKLDDDGYLYKKDGALWFKSTEFGDDKDRVLIKENGEYTYFSSDVAYHWNKFQRVDHVIDIWGCDHHGYIQRVASVCDALGCNGEFEVLLGQFVNLLRNGEPVRMSKRKGIMVTFRELIDEVGPDAVRYTLISRSSNQTIDFDIEAVKEKAQSNPVYYVQYAHARICSILRRAAGVTEEEADELGMEEVARRAIGGEADLSLLTDETEANMARKLSEFTELVASCARDRAPFRITHYVEELAGDFHGFYANCQVLPSEGHPVDPELSKARLAACDAVRITLALALSLIGVSAPEKM
ncbi:MAG: arginine--tRNA ligase [Atopobiaceae bacterium]|nr:arginine--tRNA ligase [Atopobiaceae bacterium]MCI2172856.1 arginine--tRNA ligase [Atopobiaceae bacterium]MCI2207163.1 arginine--tRNA ligase [Atopobiaceae bacterium]